MAVPRPGSTARSPLPWLAGILLAYLVAPLALFLARSAGHPSEGFSQAGLFGALATSAEAATITTSLVALCGLPLAYLLARHHGRLAGIAGAAVQLPLALPPLVSGVVLLYLFGPNSTLGTLANGRFTESVMGIVLAQSFVSSPFLVIGARSAFRAVGADLEEVAATTGMGPLARYLRVALPLAGPGVRAALVLTWLRAFGEYGATVMMSYYPFSLPVFIYVQFSAVGLPATQAPALLALGLATIVVILGRAHFPAHFPARRRSRERAAVPVTAAAVSPAVAAGPPVPVGFRLSITTGSFHLELAHQAGSHRLAIVGPSGAGKSLTLRALAGLLPGDVTFAERPVGHLPAEHRRVGYVPQGQALLPDRSA
ncbi:MAG TPA: ABC transporter permease subunit, partial [Acidimicrobiales bacterium]|nr:ABC transporter permease subunit [Acidimicrobiales bacterium]